MTRMLLSIACHVYGLATIVYLTHLVRQLRGLAVVGRVVLAVGLVLHGAALVVQVTGQGGVPLGMAQGLSLLSFLLLAIFFAIDLVYRRPVIGAFVTPLALAILVPAFIVPAELAPLPEPVRGPLLPVHIAIALLGVAAFAVAAGVGLMYVVMERQMKGKRFGLLFSRLPPLMVLDELNRWLVVLGFIALSITLATGAFFDSTFGFHLDPKRIATLIGWILFALLLGARSLAGWRGRRVALVTMAGFCILLVSFLSSYDPGRFGGGGVH
ncbi:MAG: cytochrome c biogenesis protein CcsA [Myxococcaceae bacterium]|nr:cytochrome c biogenesis protein CcsA [Myxococcaceae bacterium]